jgi:hypothetical protein
VHAAAPSKKNKSMLRRNLGLSVLYFPFRQTNDPFKVQHPGAAEIRFVRLIRLGCGGSLGRAENTEAREGGDEILAVKRVP